MKRLLALFCFLLMLSQAAFATAQFPEILVLDGTPKAMFTNPLEPWLTVQQNADKLKPYVSEQRCSASWRGYRGTWEIKNNSLQLVKLTANPCSQPAKDVPLFALFGDRAAPITASWFSGRLVVPDGNQTKYVHMGYMSQYERYQLFHIERGRVVHSEMVTELPRNLPAPNPFPANDGPPPPRMVP